jgi:hypothetical protein
MKRKSKKPSKSRRSASDALNDEAVATARQRFRQQEPRNLFYRAATELIKLAIDGKTSITVAEALALLLQTWNKAHYQYRRFDDKHLSELEQLILANQRVLGWFRSRSIATWNAGADLPSLEQLFKSFEIVLGPVGAAKALHLLAPQFLPIWDREIARCYGLTLGRKGSNAERYIRFLEIAKIQCASLSAVCGTDPLKAVDEYNYCKFTKRWL